MRDDLTWLRESGWEKKITCVADSAICRYKFRASTNLNAIIFLSKNMFRYSDIKYILAIPVMISKMQSNSKMRSILFI